MAKMTREELKESLKEEIGRAEYADESYVDCVPIGLLKEALEALSTESHKMGKWMVNKRLGGRIQCSECGAFAGLTEDDIKEGYRTANYCFSCGAEMEDEERIKEILKQHEN